MDEFEFQVSAEAGSNAASAKDLFEDGGRILSSVSEHPPDELYNGKGLTNTTLKCPLLSQSGSPPKWKAKKSLWSVFKARKKGQTNMFEHREGFNLERQTKWPRERDLSSQIMTSQSSSERESARSLFQDKDFKNPWEKDGPTLSQGRRKLTSSFSNISSPPPHSSFSAMLALSASSKSNGRWKLKGSKILHRSVSEGQAWKTTRQLGSPETLETHRRYTILTAFSAFFPKMKWSHDWIVRAKTMSKKQSWDARYSAGE